MASPALRSLSNTRIVENRRGLSGPEVAPDRISRKAAAILLVLLVTFVLLQSLIPLRTAIRIGADEDFELAKATLSLKGYHFYTEVWNDQPLLHTFLVTQVLKHLSPSILGPRLVTSAFAVLLLTSVFFIGLRVSGLWVAALTSAMLIASPGFLELSSSCMVEVPALAPAAAGLSTLLMGRQGKWQGIISGVLFAIAFQVKFINVILLPLAAFIIWLRHGEAVLQRSAGIPPATPSSRDGCVTLFRALLLLGTSLAISFLAVHFLVGEGSFGLQLKQSWLSHFAATKSFEYGSPEEHPFDWSIYLKNWDTTIPAIVGIIACSRQIRKIPLSIIPLAWFALELVVFGIHKPWWSYYYVHNAVPLYWCAAIGLEAAWKKANSRRTPVLFALVGLYAICAGAWMVSRVYLQITGIRQSPQTYSSLVLTEIERFKPFTQLIYTDEPIYSFHTGIPVPPKLGIIPLKRLWSGDMTNEKIAAELWATKPGVILLANNTRAVPFDDLLNSEYRLVYQDDKHRLYAQKAVIAQAKY